MTPALQRRHFTAEQNTKSFFSNKQEWRAPLLVFTQESKRPGEVLLSVDHSNTWPSFPLTSIGKLSLKIKVQGSKGNNDLKM